MVDVKNRYRFWNKETKCMLSWIEMTHDIEAHIMDAFEQKDIIPLQNTGLKDKNGVEVYEGDIVMGMGSDKRVVEVSYDNKWGYFYPFGTDDYSWVDSYYDFEVIGNVYENRELLAGLKEGWL